MSTYVIYKATNKLNNKIFIGKATFNKEVNIKRIYPRGKEIDKDVREFKIENFLREIIFSCNDKRELNNKFKEIVSKDFLKNNDTYNNDRFGKIVVKTPNGNIKISTLDENFINKIYETTSKNKLAAKDKDGNIFYIDKSDERYKSKELVPIQCGKVNVIDENRNIFQTDVLNSNYINGTYKFISEGKFFSETSKAKCRETHDKKNVIKRHLKFENFKYDLHTGNNCYVIKDLCNHLIEIKPKHFQKLYKLNYNDNRVYCDKCLNDLINEYNPNEEQIIKHQSEFNILFDKNYSIHSDYNYLRQFYPYILKALIVFTGENYPWKEQIFKFRKNIKFNKCLHSNCDKETSYSTSNKKFNMFCKKHIKSTSSYEFELQDFLKNNNITNYLSNYRKFGKELDIYIPDKNLAIEYNGFHYHSDEFLEKTYHYDKWLMCKNKGIKLISIWADDWDFKKDIVKSIILNSLNLTQNKLNARDCQIKEISYKDSKLFLEKNHIQGNCMSSIRVGLFYNNELVSLMTFGKRKINKKEMCLELLRYCSKLNTSIRGGASKLFNYFLKTYNPSDKIISYASCDISDGSLYKILGFKEIGHTGLNYWWADDKRHHRSNFMKYKLVEQGFDPNKKATQIMKERKFRKIYGTGNIKYEYIN